MPQAAAESEFSEMINRGPSDKEQWAAMARYGTVGIEMGLCVIFGWWFGTTADEWFGSAPYGLNLGLFFGVAAGFNALWRMYKLIASEHEIDHNDTDNATDR